MLSAHSILTKNERLESRYERNGPQRIQRSTGANMSAVAYQVWRCVPRFLILWTRSLSMLSTRDRRREVQGQQCIFDEWLYLPPTRNLDRLFSLRAVCAQDFPERRRKPRCTVTAPQSNWGKSGQGISETSAIGWWRVEEYSGTWTTQLGDSTFQVLQFYSSNSGMVQN